MKFFMIAADGCLIADRKIKLISTAWSDNPRKGGPFYKWLDDNLDFERFEYTFVGRVKQQFNNITHIEPQALFDLASMLRDHDIYITASLHEPCSNALLEALACGLPALYRNGGGSRELVEFGGLPFNDEHDFCDQLDRSGCKSIPLSKSSIYIKPMDVISMKYLQLAEKIELSLLKRFDYREAGLVSGDIKQEVKLIVNQVAWGAGHLGNMINSLACPQEARFPHSYIPKHHFGLSMARLTILDRINLVYIWVRTDLTEKTRWRRRHTENKTPGVFFGLDRFPKGDQKVFGGQVKLLDLNARFTNQRTKPNLLYLVSSALPYFPEMMACRAKNAGAKLIINQNGVAYPGWHGAGWEKTNLPMRRLLEMADYVIYQSQFCKIGADKYLGSYHHLWF